MADKKAFFAINDMIYSRMAFFSLTAKRNGLSSATLITEFLTAVHAAALILRNAPAESHTITDSADVIRQLKEAADILTDLDATEAAKRFCSAHAHLLQLTPPSKEASDILNELADKISMTRGEVTSSNFETAAKKTFKTPSRLH